MSLCFTNLQKKKMPILGAMWPISYKFSDFKTQKTGKEANKTYTAGAAASIHIDLIHISNPLLKYLSNAHIFILYLRSIL